MKFKCYMSNQIKHSKSDNGERIRTIVPIDTELAFSRIINRHVILDNQNDKVYYTSEMYNPNLRFIEDYDHQNSIRKSLKSSSEFDIGYCEVQPEYLVEWLNWKLKNLTEENHCRWNDELLKSEINNLKQFIKKVKRILELK